MSEDISPITILPSRWQFALRDIFIATTTVSIYLAAYVWIFRKLWQSEAFRAGLVVGLIVDGTLAVTYSIRRATAKRKAGPILLQLDRPSSRIHSFMGLWGIPLLVVLLVPLTIVLDAWIGISGPYPAWCMLIGYSLMLLTIVNCQFLFRLHSGQVLTIRTNGLIVNRIDFVAWDNIGARKALFDERGRLVIRRGLRNVIALVPPDKREAVESLLREKTNDALRSEINF